MKNQLQNNINEEERFDLRIPRSSDSLNQDGINVDFDHFHHINREKREMYSPPPCNFKRCAFDIPDVNRNATTAKQTSETAIVHQRPANCEDLKLIGHVLSGFYLVQPNQSNIANYNNKIRMVYCDFSLKKFQSSKNLTGKAICFQIKSKYLNFTMEIIVQIETNNLVLVF